jgi:hypothetical protein
VFLSLCGVYEENNQQNNLRDKKISELIRALSSNEKDKVIANRLTSKQAL